MYRGLEQFYRVENWIDEKVDSAKRAGKGLLAGLLLTGMVGGGGIASKADTVITTIDETVAVESCTAPKHCPTNLKEWIQWGHPAYVKTTTTTTTRTIKTETVPSAEPAVKEEKPNAIPYLFFSFGGGPTYGLDGEIGGGVTNVLGLSGSDVKFYALCNIAELTSTGSIQPGISDPKASILEKLFAPTAGAVIGVGSSIGGHKWAEEKPGYGFGGTIGIEAVMIENVRDNHPVVAFIVGRLEWLYPGVQASLLLRLYAADLVGKTSSKTKKELSKPYLEGTIGINIPLG